jgi:integrase
MGCWPGRCRCPTNLIARLLYGCGLRLTGALNLRLKDVDLEGAVLFIRGAKGGKTGSWPWLPA